MKKIIGIIAVVVVAIIAWRFGVEDGRSNAAVSTAYGSSNPVQSATDSSSVDQVADDLPYASLPGSPPPIHSADKNSHPVAHSDNSMTVRPFESRLLTNNMVNDNATKMLEANNFDQVVNSLDAENAGRDNPVTDKYRAQVQDTLAKVAKQSQIDRFACGANICMASIRTPEGDSSFKDWYDGLQPNSPDPVGSLAGYDVKLPGGIVEHRILFTTQPGSSGFVIKNLPPRTKPT